MGLPPKVMVFPGYPGSEWHTHLMAIMQHEDFPQTYHYEAEKDWGFMNPEGEMGADKDAWNSGDFLQLLAMMVSNGFKYGVNHWGGIRLDLHGKAPKEVVGLLVVKPPE